MGFTFGREERIGRWLRERPKSFLDWEKIEGVLTPELCDQHKQEEGTPMLLGKATSRNVSRALNEINGFDWEGDFKPMALQVLKDLVQKQLEEEMAEYLGLSRYEHALDRLDYRNGYYVRHLLTEMGDLELLVPCLRRRIQRPKGPCRRRALKISRRAPSSYPCKKHSSGSDSSASVEMRGRSRYLKG